MYDLHLALGYAGEVFNGTLCVSSEKEPGVSSMQVLSHPSGPKMDCLVEPSVHAVDFEMESIIDKRKENATEEYVMKWVRFEEYGSTWDPASNLADSGNQAFKDYDAARNEDETLKSDVAEHADFLLCVGKADAKKRVRSDKDVYWNNPRFEHQKYHARQLFKEMMAPVEAALKAKYGFEIKFAAIYCLDNSSGHTAMSETALDAKNVTKGSTGKKGSKMHDTTYTDHLCLKSRVAKQHKQTMS